MKYVKLIIYCALLFVLIKYTFFMATDYQTFAGRNHLPFVLWVIDMINLFIHEAGHVVFYFFGRFFHFLGGTLLQILIPIVTAIVFAKSNWASLPFTLYWVGHNFINSSIYIGDAPYRKLRLISASATHDWNWIFNYLGIMEEAEIIAEIVNLLGIMICISGICIGLLYVILEIRGIINPDYSSDHKYNFKN